MAISITIETTLVDLGNDAAVSFLFAPMEVPLSMPVDLMTQLLGLMPMSTFNELEIGTHDDLLFLSIGVFTNSKVVLDGIAICD